MPQRVNAKSDIGNSKIASDVYDTNNIFLTDQGWVYRHWKGDPTNPDARYWDEILVAGKVDPELYPESANSQPYAETLYAGTGEGSQKFKVAEKGMYEPSPSGTAASDPGDPDTHFDIAYSQHYFDGVLTREGDVLKYGPHNYDFDALRDEDGNVLPPPLAQYPPVLGYETPGVTPNGGDGGDGGDGGTGGATSPTPQAINGYYPLYTLEADANAAGDGSSHTHEFDGTTYYMPNGVTFYHGDYSG
jgi:hypothetical protein